MKETLHHIITITISLVLLYGCNIEDKDPPYLYSAQPEMYVEGFVKNTNNEPLQGIKIDMLYQDDTDITNLSEEDIKRMLTTLRPVFVEPQKNLLCTNENGYYGCGGLASKQNVSIFVIATDSSKVYCSAIVATDIIIDEECGCGESQADFILERRQ